MVRNFVALLLCALLVACSHPLEILGQGDIVELNNGIRGCTYEEFLANDKRCENWVIDGSYDVKYAAIPRPGWEFVGWSGTACGVTSKSNYCEFIVSDQALKDWVAAYPFTVFPPTVAEFKLDGTAPVTTEWSTGAPISDLMVLGLIVLSFWQTF